MGAGSSAEDLWHRLNALDSMNRASVCAATMLSSALPFILIVTALAGESAASSFRRAGRRRRRAADQVGLSPLPQPGLVTSGRAWWYRHVAQETASLVRAG